MGICEGCKKNKGMFEKFEILKAEGQAKAFDLVNKSFKGNAQALKKLEVCQASLENNTKVIVPSDKQLINVIGSLTGIDK